MESLRELYRIGPGPSSSHSLGVRNACRYYHDRYGSHDLFHVDLYGSLSLTGKGHMTDKVIYDYFGADRVTVSFVKEQIELKHPNTMKLYCVEDGKLTNEMTIYSVGGGAIRVEGETNLVNDGIYPQTCFTEILDYCRKKNITVAEYVYECEPDIRDYLQTVMEQMITVIDNGLKKEGYLPGSLHLQKVAGRILARAKQTADPVLREKLTVTAYAYSALEENACGEEVVTAPTLGASGVVSSLVKYYYCDKGFSQNEMIDALAVAGIIGNVVKRNASISGAAGGCQAEIGTACAMGAGLVASLNKLSLHQIDYAAEIAIEHNLGLTCDPIGGYVQIPCIERNGVGALRSIDAAAYSQVLGEIRENRISFDMAVDVMNYTGRQIPVELKETSLGGLALELKLDSVQEDL